MSEDCSPALGGDRAPEPPPETPAEPAPAQQTSTPPPTETAFDLRGFASLFGFNVSASANSDTLLGALESFVTVAAQAFEEQIPSTLAALDGIVDAVEQALEPLFAEDAPPAPPTEPPTDARIPPA